MKLLYHYPDDYHNKMQFNSSIHSGTSFVNRPSIPILTSRKLDFPPKFRSPRQVWISNLDAVEEEKLGMINIHPDVFASLPRVDVLHENIRWQQLYRHVVSTSLSIFNIRFYFILIFPVVCKYESETWSEGRWQETPTSERNGSVSTRLHPIPDLERRRHRPRSPISHSLFLHAGFRCQTQWSTSRSLRQTSSSKSSSLTTITQLTIWIFKKIIVFYYFNWLTLCIFQDDLHVVDSLEVPSDNPSFLEDLVEERGWGPSVLFVDE